MFVVSIDFKGILELIVFYFFYWISIGLTR
jgi:hypothetical protein